MITADGSRAAAVHLARKIGDARREFAFGCETAELEEGVRRARAAKEPTVFLTDSGDNVTASTPGGDSDRRGGSDSGGRPRGLH